MPTDPVQPTDSKIKEKITIEVRTGGEVPERNKYVVTDKAAREASDESLGSEGIFKNGKLYKPGDEIELDEQTAARFKELGEVRNVKK